jgi:glycerol-3-phosphate dehydrogenase
LTFCLSDIFLLVNKLVNKKGAWRKQVNLDEDLYDVLIIGGGVSGAATAYALAAYDLRVALVEKCVDFGFGVTKANSGIIHAGFHHDLSTLKSRLEIVGNLMFDELHEKLKFPFKRNGIIVAAFAEGEIPTVRELYERGVANGVPGIELCERERMLELEPALNPAVCGGLYAPNGGVIEPYLYTFALIESAVINGLDTAVDFEVCAAEFKDGYWQVSAADGRMVKARYAVNAAGLYADNVSAIFDAEKFTIIPRKGEEYLLDRNSPVSPAHVIFPVPTPDSKGTLVIPTVEGTTMLGPTAEIVEDKEDESTTERNLRKILKLASNMISGVSVKDIITSFSGLRPTLPGDDFFIASSTDAENFIQVAGIQSPGLTASPALGEYVRELLAGQGMEMRKKSRYIDSLPSVGKVRTSCREELEQLIAFNPAYGNIVCRCENISEAEIVRAVRKGHCTLDGVKFYTRAGMGRCQGGFCSGKIIEIIHRESGIPIEHITKRGGGTWLLKGSLSGTKLHRDELAEGVDHV